MRVTGDPVGSNNGVFYLHTDHLGSTSLVTKPDQGVFVNPRPEPSARFHLKGGHFAGCRVVRAS